RPYMPRHLAFCILPRANQFFLILNYHLIFRKFWKNGDGTIALKIMSKKEILYISYDGLTDQLGQSQILPYLQGLSAKGFSITVISCEKPSAYNKHVKEIKKITESAGINWQ